MGVEQKLRFEKNMVTINLRPSDYTSINTKLSTAPSEDDVSSKVAIIVNTEPIPLNQDLLMKKKGTIG